MAATLRWRPGGLLVITIFFFLLLISYFWSNTLFGYSVASKNEQPQQELQEKPLSSINYTPYGKEYSPAKPLPRVGPRFRPTQYNPAFSCTSSEFLSALARGHHDPSKLESNNQTLTSPPGRLSFTMPNDSPCRYTPLAIYTRQDACDLLSSFGPILFRGDSLLRHLHNALVLLLRGLDTGAVRNWDMANADQCTGESLFDDGKRCRFDIIQDTDEVLQAGLSLCPQHSPRLVFDNDLPHRRAKQVSDLSLFRDLRYQEPVYSPILVHGHGLHDNLNPQNVLKRFLQPFYDDLQDLSIHEQDLGDYVVDSAQVDVQDEETYDSLQVPIHIFASVHAPGKNKPKKFRVSQGPKAVQRFNRAMKAQVDRLSQGKRAWEMGGVEMFDSYNMTDGMYTYDGTHYGYQANVEKAQIFLNYLDLVWQEIVHAGGLEDN